MPLGSGLRVLARDLGFKEFALRFAGHLLCEDCGIRRFRA